MKPRLKIAVYYPWIYLKGGCERSIGALISRSQHDWTIFTSRYEPENTFDEFRDFKIVQTGRVSVNRNMGAVLAAALRIFTLRLPVEEFDAYVVWCDGLGPLTTFRNARVPTFCICSTPLRPVYDPVYARDALNGRKLPARLAYHLFKNVFRFIDRMAWKRFDGVVATSLEVKDRIVSNDLYPEDDRLVLHYPGIDFNSAPKSVAYEPFLLVPGRISWTKNIQLAIDAYLRADLPGPWKLVIAGFVDHKSQAYLQELKQRTKGDPRIEFVVSPSDAVLGDLYRRTSAVLFTPLNEDWGIAPLEGMLNAKPVIANNRGGPAESILPGITGWLLPQDVQAWAEAIRQVWREPDRVRKMGTDAQQHVQRYDWSQFFTGVDKLIARVAADRSHSPRTRLVLDKN